MYAALLRTDITATQIGNNVVVADQGVLTWMPAVVGLLFLVPAVLATYHRKFPLAVTLVATALVPCAQLGFVTPGMMNPGDGHHGAGTEVPPTYSMELQSAVPEILATASYVFSLLCIVQLVILLVVHWNPHLKVPKQAMHTLGLTLSGLFLAGVWHFRGTWTQPHPVSGG